MATSSFYESGFLHPALHQIRFYNGAINLDTDLGVT
jgi:hypothetical protein